MDLTLFLYISIFPTLISHAAAGCWIEDFDEYCNYTIECDASAAPVELPTCRTHNPTLLIENSVLDTFSMKFYERTKFADVVTSIKAINNKWTTIAPFAFNFYHCTRIDLSNNGIKTISNNAFRTSYFLRELNLSRNAIKNLYPKSFKVSDYSWTNPIKVLDLSFNLLTEISMLHNFPELKALYLHGNKLLRLKDDSFMNLHNVNVLTLNHNQLTSLNVSLVGLKNLKVLDLSFNRLSYLHQHELVYALSLEKVFMSHNNIETLDLKAFKHAKNLQIIDLSNNKIKSIVLPFYKNDKLKYLNFSNNNISVVELAGSYNLNTIEEIDFSLNNISALTPFMTKNAGNLKLLNLSSNTLSEIGKHSLTSLKNIKILDLSHNKLMKVDVNELNQCVNLEKLILDGNSLKEIDFEKLLSLTKVKVISVGGNGIPCYKILAYYNLGLQKNVTVTSTDKAYDKTNIFGITCEYEAPVNPAVGTDFKAHVLIWTVLMIVLVVILLVVITWSCVSHCRDHRMTGAIRLGIILVEEQQTSLL